MNSTDMEYYIWAAENIEIPSFLLKKPYDDAKYIVERLSKIPSANDNFVMPDEVVSDSHLSHFLYDGDISRMMYLIQSYSLRQEYPCGFTPIMCLLFNSRVSINDKKKVINQYVDLYRNLDTQNWDTETVLTLAIKKDEADIVKLLLKKGANPNISGDDDGITPLMIAAYNSQLYIMSLLFIHGADLYTKASKMRFTVKDTVNWSKNQATMDLYDEFELLYLKNIPTAIESYDNKKIIKNYPSK